MRRISMGLTEQSFLAGRKVVTRRLGWEFVRPGDRLLAVNRVMGISRHRPAVKLAEISVVSVRREPLNHITEADVEAEGFPGETPKWFVEFFCDAMGCEPGREVTRIEFDVVRFLKKSSKR